MIINCDIILLKFPVAYILVHRGVVGSIRFILILFYHRVCIYIPLDFLSVFSKLLRELSVFYLWHELDGHRNVVIFLIAQLELLIEHVFGGSYLLLHEGPLRDHGHVIEFRDDKEEYEGVEAA